MEENTVEKWLGIKSKGHRDEAPLAVMMENFFSRYSRRYVHIVL